MLIVHEEGPGQIAHVGVGRVEMPLSQGEEPLLDRQDLGDQFRSSERRSTGAGIATEAMPEPKQSAIERKRLAAEACRRWGRGEIEGAEQVARQVGLTELPPADDVFEGTGQAITAQDAGERLAQHRPQHVGAARRRNPIDHERARDERPEPPFVAIGPMAGFIDVEHRFVSDALMRLNDLAEEVDLVKDRGGIPVLLFAGQEAASFEDENALAARRHAMGQRAAARPGADDDYIEDSSANFLTNLHLESATRR